MGAANRLGGQGGQLLRGNAALGRFPADVDLQQDVLYQLQLGGLGLDGLQQVLGAHRLNELHPAHYLPHLVGLKVADEVEGRAGVGVVVQVGGHLLHPVFTADGDAGGNGLPDGVGGLHLGGRHQGDLRRLPTRLPGGGGDFLIYQRNALCKGHVSLPPCL